MSLLPWGEGGRRPDEGDNEARTSTLHRPPHPNPLPPGERGQEREARMIAQFALRMMFGMSLMWSLMPREKVSAGFFRIQMLIVMGLGVLASLTFGELSQNPE